MCQCAQRREVIVQAATGAVPVGRAATFVATTIAHDARQMAAAALATARAGLAARVRR